MDVPRQPFKVVCDEHGEFLATTRENARIISDGHHVDGCDVEPPMERVA